MLLVLLLLTAIATGGYLGVLARAWSERATVLDATAQELGEQLAQTRAELARRDAELDTTRNQLETAQDRIVELADEKAQAGDAREAQRQLADYQQRVSAAAGTVASALQECVTGQEDLIGYLKDADAYEPTDLARFEDEVAAFCAEAVAANADLQLELDR